MSGWHRGGATGAAEPPCSPPLPPPRVAAPRQPHREARLHLPPQRPPQPGAAGRRVALPLPGTAMPVAAGDPWLGTPRRAPHPLPLPCRPPISGPAPSGRPRSWTTVGATMPPAQGAAPARPPPSAATALAAIYLAKKNIRKQGDLIEHEKVS